MTRLPQSNWKRREAPTTLAETLVYFSSPRLRDELEQFRVDFEATHGATDLTRRYTSTWPPAQQEWLLEHEPQRYFDNLPSFAKAFIKRKLQMAARNGNLDDMPVSLQRLFVAGRLNTDGCGR